MSFEKGNNYEFYPDLKVRDLTFLEIIRNFPKITDKFMPVTMDTINNVYDKIKNNNNTDFSWFICSVTQWLGYEMSTQFVHKLNIDLDLEMESIMIYINVKNL